MGCAYLLLNLYQRKTQIQEMIFMKICYAALLTALLAACGGGGNNPSTTLYSFVAPPVSSQRIYTQTIVDNSNNTINESVRDTISTVSADGSYVAVRDDPTNYSITINGTTYTVLNETVNANKSGQAISYSYTPSGGSFTTCTYVPHGAGPDYPIFIGMSWSFTYTLTCGSSAPISFTQTGADIDVESVTVPAGTYSALKLQSTISWTDLAGTTHTNTETNWREVNTGISVKSTIFHTYGGTALAHGYPVTTSAVLQSGTP
jgi:hypothetical protein